MNKHMEYIQDAVSCTKLIHGDCLDKMQEIESGIIDLTVTSPEDIEE